MQFKSDCWNLFEPELIYTWTRDGAATLRRSIKCKSSIYNTSPPRGINERIKYSAAALPYARYYYDVLSFIFFFFKYTHDDRRRKRLLSSSDESSARRSISITLLLRGQPSYALITGDIALGLPILSLSLSLTLLAAEIMPWRAAAARFCQSRRL